MVIANGTKEILKDNSLYKNHNSKDEGETFLEEQHRTQLGEKHMYSNERVILKITI